MFSYYVSLNKALWKVISVFCFVFLCVSVNYKANEHFLLERAESLFWSECYLKLVNTVRRCEVSTLHSLEGLDCRRKNIEKNIYSPWGVTLHSLPSLTLLRCLTGRSFNVLTCSWFGTRSLLEMLKILALGIGTSTIIGIPHVMEVLTFDKLLLIWKFEERINKDSRSMGLIQTGGKT